MAEAFHVAAGRSGHQRRAEGAAERRCRIHKDSTFAQQLQQPRLNSLPAGRQDISDGRSLVFNQGRELPGAIVPLQDPPPGLQFKRQCEMDRHSQIGMRRCYAERLAWTLL